HKANPSFSASFPSSSLGTPCPRSSASLRRPLVLLTHAVFAVTKCAATRNCVSSSAGEVGLGTRLGRGDASPPARIPRRTVQPPPRRPGWRRQLLRAPGRPELGDLTPLPR